MTSTPKPPPDDRFIYVVVECHCGINTCRVAFDAKTSELHVGMCHCNLCRHTSGELGTFQISIEGNPIAHYENKLFDLSSLTRFHPPERNTLKYFCPMCGAHMFWERHPEGVDHPAKYYRVAAGLLERVQGIASASYHLDVEDTRDGGLADLIIKRGDMELPRYAHEIGSPLVPPGWKDFKNLGKEITDDETVQAYCHCRGISLTITRPNEASGEQYAAFPDLLMPYDVSHLSRISNLNNEKWWLCPKGAKKPTKFFAGHCACRSCRLTSGFPIKSWEFIPTTNIINNHTGKLLELEGPNRPPELHQYIASPGRYTEFCAKCGASAFLWGTSRRNLPAVSAGLIDEKQEGARAERWFDWYKERVSFADTIISRPLIQSLIDGLKKAAEDEKASEQTSGAAGN